MSKQAIPTVFTGKPDLDRALAASKQNLDAITGQARGVPHMAPLPATATLADAIARLNEIAERLQ